MLQTPEIFSVNLAWFYVHASTSFGPDLPSNIFSLPEN